jgi:glycosyltransferase involved in cell wall biosynthesis
MSSGSPRFTVVTPSLNQVRFIERSIRSVVDQGYPNLEYFVMDAGSTDGSVDVIKRYADRIDYWVSAPDGGQSAAINAGWSRGSGEIVAWLNSDDFYLPGSLATVAAYMQAHPDVMVVYGKCEIVDRDGEVLDVVGEPYRRRTMVMSRNVIPQPATFIRREALDAVGMLDESLDFVMDMELFLRVGQIRAPRFLDETFAGMTRHPDAKTSRGRIGMSRERWAIRLRYARGAEIPILWIGHAMSRLLHALPDGVRDATDRLRRLDLRTG